MHYYSSGKYLEAPALPATETEPGLFETVLFNGSTIAHLDRHIERITSSARALGITMPNMQHRQIEEIFQELIQRNRLSDGEARLNLYCFQNREPMLTAQAYTRPPMEAVSLSLYKASSQYLHKSTNRTHLDQARNTALGRGYFDALLTDSSGTFLETTISGLIINTDKGLAVTPPKARLNSIAVSLVSPPGTTPSIKLRKDDLSHIINIWTVNSLAGALPVGRIDDISLSPDPKLAMEFNQLIRGEYPATTRRSTTPLGSAHGRATRS